VRLKRSSWNRDQPFHRPSWLRLCWPCTYQPGEIPTLRATAAVCRVSISLLVSTRQSTYTAKSRVVEAGLKLPGRAFSVLPARSLFSQPQPGARSILDFSVVLSFSVFPVHRLSLSFSFALTFSSTPVSSIWGARNARVCARTLCTRARCNWARVWNKRATLSKTRRWTRGCSTERKACLYVISWGVMCS